MIQASVVMPAFNVAPWIGEAIASALAQSLEAIELIVVDDGSTDGTIDIVRHWQNEPRLRLIQQKNGGPSQSRNAALAIAQGAYIGFLDADDRWHPDKLADHIRLMDDNPAIDLSFSWWRVIDACGNDTGRRGRPDGGLYHLADLMRENVTGTASTVVARRAAIETVGGFDEGLRANVDLDLWLRIAALHPDNVVCLPKILTDYRQRPGQIVSDWNRMEQNWRKVLARAESLDPLSVAAIRQEAEALYARYVAYIAYQAGDWPSARHRLAQAWRYSPKTMARDRRAWLTSLAIAATFLPKAWLDRLADRVKETRARMADDHG